MAKQGGEREAQVKKKADAAEHLEVFHRVGLLHNEPPGTGRAAF
jgi:hypothetical protein